MVTVEKATPAMFDDIYPLLLELDNTLSTEKWRSIFDYNWESDEGYVGYALVDGRTAVGFNGTLFSRRIIDGKEVKFCNLTSWIVKEQYRSEAMRLVFPILGLKGYTLTNLTMNDKAWSITKRLGFKNLDTNTMLLFPVPELTRSAERDSMTIESDLTKITELLDPEHLKIFRDHMKYACGHLVIHDKYSYCYILYTGKHYKRYNCEIPYGQIHYISNRSLFLKYLNKIKFHFLKNQKYVFLAIDERLIGNTPLPYSKVYPLKIPKMYKSEILTAEQIDNLYSELVVLGL